MRKEIAGKLEETAEALVALQKLPAERLAASYGVGKWTAQEIINHLADAALAFHWRFLRCVAGEGPEVQMFAHDQWVTELREKERPVELSASLVDAIHRSIAWYVRTASDEQLARFCTHPVRGNLTALKLAELVGNHAAHHLTQLVAIRDGRAWVPPAK